MQAIEEFNLKAKSWADLSKRELKLKMLQLNVKSTGGAIKSLNVVTLKKGGEVNRIGFKFRQYLVYVHKGAGRGYGGKNGSKWIPKRNIEAHSKSSRKEAGQFYQSTNIASLGRMGTGKRKPKLWFNPVIEENFPALADFVLDFYGETTIAKIQTALIK